MAGQRASKSCQYERYYMIGNITSNSPFITVNTPSPYIPQNYNAGQLRYNTSNQIMEVYDGNGWRMLTQTASISVSPVLDNIINWATVKMEEERRIKEKAKKFPSVADALNEFEYARERLLVVESLCNEEELNQAVK